MGFPLWRYSGEPIGRVTDVTDCCGGLMFKVDMDMSLYKKPKKKEKKKMFGRKDREIEKLKKDLEFWKNMDVINTKNLCSYHDIFRKNEATIRMLEEANELLRKDIEAANKRFECANAASRYWFDRTISAREELLRKNECSGYSYTSALDALKIYTLKSENLQLKKDNAELGGKCIEYERVLREFKLRYPGLYGIFEELLANKTTP